MSLFFSLFTFFSLFPPFFTFFFLFAHCFYLSWQFPELQPLSLRPGWLPCVQVCALWAGERGAAVPVPPGPREQGLHAAGEPRAGSALERGQEAPPHRKPLQPLTPASALGLLHLQPEPLSPFPVPVLPQLPRPPLPQERSVLVAVEPLTPSVTSGMAPAGIAPGMSLCHPTASRAVPGEILGLSCQPALCLDEHCPGGFSLAGFHRVIYPLALCPWAQAQVGWVTWGRAVLSQKLLQPLPGLELCLHQTFEGAESAPVACPRPACSLACTDQSWAGPGSPPSHWDKLPGVVHPQAHIQWSRRGEGSGLAPSLCHSCLPSLVLTMDHGSGSTRSWTTACLCCTLDL